MTETKIKKGLFIGIDYVGTRNELQNCRNDARDMEKLINEKYGIQFSVLLLDDATDDKKPTRTNITRWIEWLTDGLASGDNVWIHYSGHGGYVTDQSGDEKDGRDETLIPVDFNESGEILDDELNKILCEPVARNGANLYFHDDCCHSGTGADLQFRLIEAANASSDVIEEAEYNHANYTQYPISYADIYYPYYSNKVDNYLYSHNNKLHTMKELWDIFYDTFYFPYPDYKVLLSETGREVVYIKKRQRDLQRGVSWEIKDNGYKNLEGTGRIVKWSGCKDDQTSADGFNGMANGAMTGSVITVFKNGTASNWGDFLEQVRELLKKGGFEQIPQLCSNIELNYQDKCFAI